MRSRNIRLRSAALMKKLRRAYRHSELRKLQRWLKGKTLHPALYLVLVLFMLGTALGVHHYYNSFFYVVELDGREIGAVREAVEVEQFVADLTAKCSSFYGVPVEPEQEITLIREYRSCGESDAPGVKRALLQQISLAAEAVMLTVDRIPVIPMVSAEEINEAVERLSEFYAGRADNRKNLKVTLVEEITATPCTVSPETIYTPEEAAVFLRDVQKTGENRLLLAGRSGNALRNSSPGEWPAVHVQTVEEVRVVENIPCQISYRYTDTMWCSQSRVLVQGRAGKKEVAYHVTRENGREIARQRVKETILENPVTRVIEKGTSPAPSIGSGLFIWPVRGGMITSGYRSAARPGHTGVDIGHPAGAGTPILAADDGVVVETGSEYPRGNYVVIYHGDYYTLYAHNQVNKVSPGKTVKRGEVIALMGNTGRTYGLTGVHLHFEVRLGNRGSWSRGAVVNPMSFF